MKFLNSLQIFVVTLLFCGLSSFATAKDEVLDHFFHELRLGNADQSRNFSELQESLRNSQLDRALSLARKLIDDNDELIEADPTTYGKLLVNLGILHSYQGSPEHAMTWLDSGLEFVEDNSNPFASTVREIMMARGLTQLDLGAFDEAEESFRRAQHIAHRIGGVYTPEQLEIINYITSLHLKQGRLTDADREQGFNLRISEQAYGKDSEELVPILQRIGAYFASRGAMIPLSDSPDFRYYRDSLFRQSLDVFKRSVKIIEDNYGVNDLRLIEPLRGLARTRLLQISNRSAAEDALERALAIVESNPDTDIPDRIKATLDLADLYTITGDPRGKETYLKTWDLIHQDPSAEQLSADLFGSPTRLHPEVSGVVYLGRKPDAALEGDVELYIDVEYTVRANGRVGNIKLLDKNVPNAQVRSMRYKLSGTRFRPRIIDGELVDTDKLMIHQTFQVLGSEPPQSNISIDQIQKRPLLVPNHKVP